jgi:hypothetical protein
LARADHVIFLAARGSTVNLKSWLRHNFSLRRLRPLGARAGARLFGGFRLPTLLPRRPFITPEREISQTADEPLTDASVRRDGRELRLLSSDPVRFELEYREWIAPLMKLPPDATAEALREAIHALPGFDERGQMFFPLEVYRQSLPRRVGVAVEWAHYCRASRQPAIDLLLARVGQAAATAHIVDTSVLLLYARTLMTGEQTPVDTAHT